MNLSKLCVSKLRELDLDGVTHVLIENQPALKNPVYEKCSDDYLYIFCNGWYYERKLKYRNYSYG